MKKNNFRKYVNYTLAVMFLSAVFFTSEGCRGTSSTKSGWRGDRNVTVKKHKNRKKWSGGQKKFLGIF